MACYILSSDNRSYVSKEGSFGIAGALSESGRFPASSVQLRTENLYLRRRDKTGSRTATALPGPLRRSASFAVKSYLTANMNPATAPSYGPLFEAAMGGAPLAFAGGAVDSVVGSGVLRLTSPHGLSVGQGVSFGGEIRFVTAIVDAYTIGLNAEFTVEPSSGSSLGPTVSYSLAKSLPSVSVYDFWSPVSALQRVACGAMVDRMKIAVNGDVHEFEFSGPAADIVDDASFIAGAAGLSEFPEEPASSMPYSAPPVPGHLGQAWMGAQPEQFATITQASITLENNVDLRAREFGSLTARCGVPGDRAVRFDCTLFGRDDAATKGLYQAARQRSGIQVMLQLGQQSGQLLGVYAKSVIPEAPKFDDRESRLQWSFSGCMAQGNGEDELYIAFG